MLRRGLMVSGLGLSLAMVGAGVVAPTPAFAQEEESSPAGGTLVAARGEHFEDFLERFAENLGVEPEDVRAAAQATMIELIDERVEAGDLPEDIAEELKAAIEDGSFPMLMGRFGGFHDDGPWHLRRGKGFHDRGRARGRVIIYDRGEGRRSGRGAVLRGRGDDRRAFAERVVEVRTEAGMGDMDHGEFLKAMIDEQVEAGELSDEAGEELKAAIDARLPALDVNDDDE